LTGVQQPGSIRLDDDLTALLLGDDLPLPLFQGPPSAVIQTKASVPAREIAGDDRRSAVTGHDHVELGCFHHIERLLKEKDIRIVDGDRIGVATEQTESAD
jgi:hypothetical protein